jgi:hypothetical protein
MECLITGAFVGTGEFNCLLLVLLQWFSVFLFVGFRPFMVVADVIVSAVVVVAVVDLSVSNLQSSRFLLRHLILVGLNFLITEIPFEVFTYSETDPMCFEETPEDPFPYMVRINKPTPVDWHHSSL